MLQTALDWVQSLGAVGAIAFIVLYALATVLFVPGTLLTLGGGAIFGVVWGSIYVFLGATIGAVAAFLVGRYLARDRVARRIENNVKLTAIDTAIGREGLKIVVLTRLSPVFPFVLLNYAFGLTQVTLRDYILGCVGMIPATILYVYLGSIAGSLATLNASHSTIAPETQTAQWTIRIAGLIATIAVTVIATRIASKALQESVSK